MRVVVASSLFEVQVGGGAARSARLIAEGMAQRGHDVVVITTAKRGQQRFEMDGTLKVHRLAPHNLYWVGEKDRRPLPLRVPWQILDTWNPFLITSMRRILQQYRPDVLHAQKLRGLSPAVWTAAANAGVPIIQTCRDYELISPEGTLSGTLGRLALRRSMLLRPYQQLRAWIGKAVSAVTAPSEHTLATIRQAGFFRNAPSRVIPNSHGYSLEELSALRSPKRRAEPGMLSVLYLGRLERTKGVDHLCRAVAALSIEGVPVTLTVAGWGALKEELQREFANCPAICFKGALFGDEKRSVLAAADLLTVPSVWPEVFGNVVAEAFAHGLPALVSDAGGLPELVSPGRTGFVFPAGDEEALRQQLAQCVGDNRLAMMSAACHEEAERFSMERVLERYEEVYDYVIRQPRSARVPT
jgi:glycosyltransferase involved in cell wall biosynthesis